jgi:magnesium chelatase subunit D
MGMSVRRVTSRSAPKYPFSAIVGMPDLKLALLLNAVDPAIGGILVRGEKGTAKSTVVRALAALLPPVTVLPGCRFSCDPAAPDPACPDGPHEDAHDPARPDGPHGDTPGERRAARMVELPVGASEDRLTGSLDLRRALAEGVATFEPGLLAAAHRGLLYVDEVNLLHDHLVDLLLDAAALGTSYVEREGVSVRHAARFLLVGTMNPEEGELRPQLLDRFGLTVEVTATRDAEERAEVVRRRMAFDAGPEGFAASWTEADAELAGRIAAARALLPSVDLSDVALRQVTGVCAAFDVDGLRADLVTARTAVALAAWSGRTSVTAEDVRQAALLALPHRRRRDPFDAPGLDQDTLDDALTEATRSAGPGDGPDDPPDGPSGGSDNDPDGAPDPNGGPDGGPGGGAPPSDPSGAGAPGTDEAPGAPGADGATGPSGDAQGKHKGRPGENPTSDGESQSGDGAHHDPPYRARLFRVPGVGSGTPGRRGRARETAGRTVGSRPPAARVTALHLPATLRAAAPHQAARRAPHPSQSTGQAAPRVPHPVQPAASGRAGRREPVRGGRALVIEPGDLREAVREGREGNLVLFLVDASGSMAARQRVRAVTGAALSLLLDAYQRRDKVALITFSGTGAEVALPPTSSVDVGAARLRNLRVGGRTPLAAGLLSAHRLLDAERLRDPRRRPLLVVITDGRATYGERPREDAERAAALLARAGTGAVVVDCESGPVRLGLAARLATALGAEHVRLDQLAADGITGMVRATRAA